MVFELYRYSGTISYLSESRLNLQRVSDDGALPLLVHVCIAIGAAAASARWCSSRLIKIMPSPFSLITHDFAAPPGRRRLLPGAFCPVSEIRSHRHDELGAIVSDPRGCGQESHCDCDWRNPRIMLLPRQTHMLVPTRVIGPRPARIMRAHARGPRARGDVSECCSVRRELRATARGTLGLRLRALYDGRHGNGVR